MDEFDDPEVLAELRALTSPEFVGVRIEHGIGRAEFAAKAANRQTAELWKSIAEIVDEAQRHPEAFIDPRAQLTEWQRRDYAERSAVADLAVRLAVAENTVRSWGHAAAVLRARTPRVWSRFCEGDISSANARIVSDSVNSLPHDAHEAFEDAVLDWAVELSPARFRAIARAARERVHHEALAERHQRAAAERRLIVDDDLDGMSWLSVYLPSSTAHRAVAGIDAAAHSMLGDDDRTLDQLRADLAGELLSGAMTATGAGVSVSVTVPVLTLLGQSDEPGVLHCVGPIDAETARRLAGEATSFTRILTHPISGTVLELDREQYRVPADLKRTLAHRDRSCRFAGCGRRATNCDIDHIAEWQDGGTTDANNLMHLCRHHHRLKSVANWKAKPPDPESNAVTWTSPTGHTIDVDPPPF
jgi:hypothetical protein